MSGFAVVGDVGKWKSDLLDAGWISESATVWRAPDGSLWRGPFGAWKELRRRIEANGSETNWPLPDVLTQLAEWVKHLGEAHDCDCHGWEAQSFLIEAASNLASANGKTQGRWFTDWPQVNGFYWLRGWREYRDLPIKTDGDSFWMMFGGAKYHKSDLADSGVLFQGPISPTE